MFVFYYPFVLIYRLVERVNARLSFCLHKFVYDEVNGECADALFHEFCTVKKEDYEQYRRASMTEVAADWARQLDGSEHTRFTLPDAVALKLKLIDAAYDNYNMRRNL